MITDEDFIRLFNACAVLAKTDVNPAVPAGSLNDTFPELNIDSLDGLIMGMYLCDAFKIPEEVGKGMRPQTVGEMKAFCVEHATVESIDVNKVLADLK